MATAPPQQFCVRWNSYHTNLQTWFPRLLMSEQFADVTLACESRQLRCHKLVLSACSAYLERLLASNPCKHPIVLMRDMRFSEMQALVDFMYKGEVNVTQEELPSLLKSAEALQIRGLCSSENVGLTQERQEGKDFGVASDALLANAQRDTTQNGPSTHKLPSPAPKKSGKEEVNVKEETVEEDGLYYGELDADNMEYNEDEEPGKPGSSLGQTSDFAISNVQCQYESGSEPEEPREELSDDHTYGARSYEPPAFVIRQSNQMQPLQSLSNFSDLRPKIMTLAPGFPTVNVIHVGDQPQTANMQMHTMLQAQPEYNINKRIRRSEVVLRQAADCVSRGLTFQTVSEQFNIPISTIRFFMARKGILPRRRRGRSIQAPLLESQEPPYHIQHLKLPAIAGLRPDDEANDPAT